MPYFDDLFAASDNVLDGLFAGPATYRASGQLLSITASVRSIGERNDGEKDVPQSWIGYVVECYAADLTISGQQWWPTGGDEIAFPQPAGGSKVYIVVSGPDGRAWEPLDTVDNKLLVFVKFIRNEFS